MTLRISSNSFYLQARANLNANLLRLARAQDEVSSGKKLQRPSDNPAAASRVLARKRDESSLDRLLANVADARSTIDPATGALQQLSNLLSDVETQVLDAINGARNASDRRTAGNAIDEAIKQALTIANSSADGRFLFGGTRTDQPPFVESASGTSDVVAFNGSTTTREVEISRGAFLATGSSGEALFGPTGRGRTVFQTETGARASSSGGDNGIGSTLLRVKHTATTYGDGSLPGGGDSASGAVPSASSASSDTVIGQAGTHKIHLTVSADGVTGTVSLDGGPAVAFVTAGASDTEVASTVGDTVHLDLTGVTAGFDGDVSLVSQGVLTNEAGLGSTPITYGANQTFTDPTTQVETHIDTTNVVRSGRVAVTYKGTQGLFETLIAIRDDLRQAGSRPADETTDLVRGRLEDLRSSRDAVISGLSELGFRSSLLDGTETRLQDAKDTVTTARARDEDVDIGEAILKLQTEETHLQTGLQLTARLFNLSLSNFLS
ncbi:MAG: flagellar hook-associated protein FlgL [Planctomycetes bacterium]|nr:flagellar hook-associated protein FlgL [Planctomycetota bacterium]MBI3843032.1 flagellar hook-associated protein FlgL [Planctomycetota bacterium]